MERFVVLDGLRGLAALAVFLLHALEPFDLEHWVPSAYLAVDFFFLLSGFVLSHAYGDALASGRLSLGAFARTRVIRLYPLFAAGLTLGLFVFCLKLVTQGHAIAPAEVFLSYGRSLLLIPTTQDLAPGWTPIFPLNVPAWSLFFEFAANLLFALGLCRLSDCMLTVFVAACGAVLIWSMIDTGRAMDWAAPSYWLASSARVGFSFFLGVLLHRWHRRMPFTAFALPPIVVALLLAATLLVPETAYTAYTDLAVMLIVSPVIVVLGVPPPASREVAALCAWAGAVSYPLYILHYPLVHFGTAAARRLGLDGLVLGGWVIAEALLAVALAVAALRFFDEPVRRMLSRKRADARAATPESASGRQALPA